MASSITLSAAAERKLRPIYDQLDNGNNKNALHEADKVLKKQRDFNAAKVLKCIALHRLGRREDAFALSEAVTANKPNDEKSLQGLSLYFREINRADLVPPIYEAALEQCKDSEEYMTHLFMAYVRTGNLKDMKRVAMGLYKIHPKNPYLFWAIMSLVMQAHQDPKMGSAMFLPLAEKMVEKQLEKNQEQVEAAEIRLYLMILDKLEKYEKSLDVLKKFGSKLLTGTDGSQVKKLAIHKNLGRWDKVNAQSRTQLRESPNVWNHALDYLDSLFHLIDDDYSKTADESGEGKSSDDPDYTLEQAVVFIKEIVSKGLIGTDTRTCRGPLLLQLEFVFRLTERKESKHHKECDEIITKFDSIFDMLQQYILYFGDKPCCYYDVAKYVSMLSVQDVVEFLNSLKEKSELLMQNGDSKELTNRQQEHKIQRRILNYQLERHCGKHDELSHNDKINLVEELLQRHKEDIVFSLDRPETDFRTADEYCVIAANVLLDALSKLDKKGSEYTTLLWRLSLLLELAVVKSPHNFRFKFLLIRVYNELGVFRSSANIYDSLEIKHMQQDTIGYTVFNCVSALGQFQLASQAFETARTYFVTNKKDLSEFVIVCFKNGTFQKILEFLSFQNRVERSLTAALAMTEHAYMDLVTQADIEVTSEILLKSSVLPKKMYDTSTLTDNRDFKVVQDITYSARSTMQEKIDESFKFEKSWVRFRDVTVRCISCVLTNKISEVKQNGSGSGDVTNEPTFTALITELEEISKKTENFKSPEISFHGPPVPRMMMCAQSKLPVAIVASLRLCEKINEACQLPSDNSLNEAIKSLSDKLLVIIQELLKSCSSSNSQSDISMSSKDIKKAEPIPSINESESLASFASSCSDSDVTEALNVELPTCLIEFSKELIERLVVACEMFSIIVLLIFSMRKKVQAVKTDAAKKRRRKKGAQEPQPPIIESYRNLISELAKVGSEVENAVHEVKNNAEVMTLDLSPLSLEENNDSTEDKKNPTENSLCQKAVKLAIKNTSSSVLASTNQLLRIVEGRIKNLKAAKL